MENYDILIKNCQVLNPDMSVSSTCSVELKTPGLKKSVQQMNSLIVLPQKHLMEKVSLLCQV